MKNNKGNRKTDYSKIKRKLYLYVLVAAIVAIVFVVLLRRLLWGSAGNFIVALVESVFDLSNKNAMIVYQAFVRNNLDILMYSTVGVCFFILCRIILSRFMRYFDEVNTGIDTLIKGGEPEIELSAEMEFMERKLNVLKQTLEKREQDAKLSEQRKNDLVMYLAHDIKTPLTSVIGYLSLLDEAQDMPVEQKAKYVHISLDKAYRLEQLINEFFEITRYNLQSITLVKENIDLYYMLVQLADEFYPQLSANGKQAVIRAPENLTVYGDPDKLARVFNNVLKNAEAYSDQNTEIVISAEEIGQFIVISFQNRGNTIPVEKLSALFEKFYRLDDSRTSSTGGSGLGLAITKEIVILHGGTITAVSENHTVTFVITLPVTH